jgi:hypothetical protein
MREGQPRGIHKLLPFKRAEKNQTQSTSSSQQARVPFLRYAEAKKDLKPSWETNPNLNLVDKEILRKYREELRRTLEANRRTWLESESLLTPVDKEQMRTPDEHLVQESIEQLAQRMQIFRENADRSLKEYQEMRAKEPQAPAFVEYDGKVIPSSEIYQAVKAKHERTKREKAAQWEPMYPAPLVPEPLPTETQLLSREEQKVKQYFAVRHIDRRLRKEVQDRRFGHIAGDIRKSIWQDTSEVQPFVTIKRTGKGEHTVKKDGAIISSSHYGYELSYVPKDEFISNIPRNTTLSFGIRYIHADSQEQVVEQARNILTPDAYERGAKAYYIESTWLDQDTREKKTNVTLIPLAYSQAKRVFYERLLENAYDLAPHKLVPMKQSTRYRRPALAAA